MLLQVLNKIKAFNKIFTKLSDHIKQLEKKIDKLTNNIKRMTKKSTLSSKKIIASQIAKFATASKVTKP